MYDQNEEIMAMKKKYVNDYPQKRLDGWMDGWIYLSIYVQPQKENPDRILHRTFERSINNHFPRPVLNVRPRSVVRHEISHKLVAEHMLYRDLVALPETLIAYTCAVLHVTSALSLSLTTHGV